MEVLGKDAVVRAHTHTLTHTNKTEGGGGGSLEKEMFFYMYCRRVRDLAASVMLAAQLP